MHPIPLAALGKTDEFKLKSSLLHHIPKFHKMSMEDPNKHLKEFEVFCSSMTHVNVDGNILKIKAFPFSLLEKAKDWLYELAPGTVTSWESMKRMAEGMRMKEPSVYGVCSIQGHASEKCPQLIENGGWESANAIAFQGHNQPRNDPYSNMYNPDNDRLLKLLTNLSQGQENQVKAMQNQDKRVDQMDKQIGQIAEFVGQFREQGKLPSSTVVNSKGGFESAKAMSLRSGKQVGSDPQPSNSRSNEVEELIIEEKEMRFMQSKKEEAEKDILETFRKVQVNIPLLDAIKQVPRYAKFLKELCTTRKRISSKEVVKVNHLIFPADFYVLEMDESDHFPTLPILLGRLFMKIARTKIDVFNGTLTMEFDGEVINFNLSDSIKYLSEDHSCFFIDVFASLEVVKKEIINPPMMEVVKKEIIKLLDCGVIYPISDSRWVSPVQCVPKKSGVTVVTNAENELVPT
ncbi:unnamed protein product [Malus baccata var. baccata]